MSEKIDITIDSSTDVEAGNEIVSTSSDNNIDIEVLEPDYNVTINKREYVITGDNMYIPKTYDESPQWLKDIIGTITDFSLNQKLTEIGALSSTLYGLIDELNVAKNTYTMSIINSAEIDERINARIETLNSSIAESDATMVDLIATKATPTEASSLALNVLTASINDGAISSLVSNLQNAISTSTGTIANNIDIVHAEMTGEFNANAEVIDSMQAYVGINEAGASTGTGVSAYLEGSNGVIGSADSKVANNVYVDGNGNTRSKFEYNSSLNIGGTSYNSGFGLATSLTNGAIPVGQSEFWINASKFKFTNTNQTGQVAPFTIDAIGTTPEITFNGKVSFNSVTDVPVPSTSIISSNWSTGSGSTGIFNMNGLATENYRVYADNHNGERVIVWECRPDSASDPDGGWNTSSFEIDRAKTYRYSVFVKTSANTGQTFLGCGGNTVANLNTTTKNSNPYFWSGVLPTQNEWYLIVGYVYPSGQTGLTHKGGIYSCVDGKKVSTITDFNWASDATTGLHRCYHYYDTVTTTRQWMWSPRVDIIDGNEPSIIDLIGKADVSSGIASNNDVFAQKLGYANYNAMVTAAASGKTIINGGYINTGLIKANAIVANQINTTGLIAENISANEIVGKTLTGTVINGAVVNGSIIKTSYLDLDGDLEILTEYHLCTSQTQLNSLLSSGGYGRLVLYSDKVENGGDAIYMTGSNEYRIPTLSVVSEPIQTFTGQGIKTLIGKIFPYNSTLSNSNLKSRKISPSISVANTSIIYSSNSLGPNAGLGYNGGSYPLVVGSPNFNSGNGTLIEIWFAGVLLIRFGSYYPYYITHRCYIYDAIAGVYVDGGYILTYSPSVVDKTLTMNTSTFDVRLHYRREYYQDCNGEDCNSYSNGNIEISILPKNFQLPFNFTSGNFEIRSVYTSGLLSFTLQIPSGISINNMI